MAHRKGKSVRGKSRVSQAPIPTREELLATLDRSGVTFWLATDHCPLCALIPPVEQEPFGPVRATVRAAVEPAPLDTV